MTFEDQLADRSSWRVDSCSVAMLFDLLSTKTTFLVLRECFYGTRRFEDFVERLGTSAPAVSRALKQLESAGCVSRVPYREPGSRARDEYSLTAAGEDLLPVMMAIGQWGDAYLQNGSSPLCFVEASTGRPVRVCVTADPGIPETRSDEIEIRARST